MVKTEPKVQCPDCGSENIHEFVQGCFLLTGAQPHYGCYECRSCFSAEYLIQLALGTAGKSS